MAEQSSHQSRDEVRCRCGSLMARVTDHGIELKCRRCKRVVLVATDQVSHEWVAVSLHREDGTMR
jgi:phage FluMu protein Com